MNPDGWPEESNLPPGRPTIFEVKYYPPKRWNFKFVTQDPNGDDIYYFIDWGDDQKEEWIGPFASGTEITKSHTWTKKGSYAIRCKAKDPYGDESEWGELEGTMPKNQQNSQNNQQSSQQSTRLLFFQILQKLLNTR